MAAETEIGAISVRIAADTGDLVKGLDDARRAVGAANQVMSSGLQVVESTSRAVFDSFSGNLERAALNGSTTMRDMVNSILADLQRVAARAFITGPLENVFNSVLGSALSFGGARAAGGPVAPGQAFLVGERGPELFVPAQPGTVVPHGRSGAAPAIVFNVQTSDAASFMRSQTQIAAMITRAARRGQRNL